MAIFDQKYRHWKGLSHRQFKHIFGNGMACGQRWQHGKTKILTLVFIRITLVIYRVSHNTGHLKNLAKSQALFEHELVT